MAIISYTHDALQYVTVHNYRASGTFCFEVGDARPYAALVYVEQGRVAFEDALGRVEAQEGDWVFLPKGQQYRSVWEGEVISYHTLDFWMTRRLIVQHVPHVSVVEVDWQPLCDRPCVVAHDDALLRRHLDELSRGFCDPGKNLLASASFYYLWDRVISLYRRGGDQEIWRAVEWIENHLLDKPDIPALCRMCCMGKTTLFHRFRAAVGTSPIQYRNRLLVQMGRAMLSTGEYSIAQVSDLLGLSSPDYFTVLCKKHLA